jgi:hypothetical protein
VQIRSPSFTGSYVMARPNNGSRMNREVHVRFWESPEVKILRAIRQRTCAQQKYWRRWSCSRTRNRLSSLSIWGSSGESRNKTSAAGSKWAMLMNGT